MHVSSTCKQEVLIGFNVVLKIECSYNRTLLHFTNYKHIAFAFSLLCLMIIIFKISLLSPHSGLYLPFQILISLKIPAVKLIAALSTFMALSSVFSLEAICPRSLQVNVSNCRNLSDSTGLIFSPVQSIVEFSLQLFGLAYLHWLS